ncbi:3-deoxy-7-phosphoheptulonate synthase [Actinosynnema sp. NPDC023794]
MANSSEPGGTVPTVHPLPRRVQPDGATPDVALTPPSPRQGGTRQSDHAEPPVRAERSGWSEERRVRPVPARTPALVLPQQCDRLTAELGQVATGQALLLHGGPGAQTSDDVSGYRYTRELALVLGHAACLPVVAVGRVVAAGPDTRRRHRNSARYLDALRALVSDPATADAARESLDRRLTTTPAAARHADVVALVRSRLAGPHPGPPDLFVSHETVPLDYEFALARTDPRTGRRFGTSGHLLWVGDRSRAHVDFLAGIDNPVAVALGPSATARDAAGLARRLNPDRVPGRLTFITRLGAGQVRGVLPRLLDAVTDTGVPVGWVCDPLHGNTFTATTGDLDDVVAEVRAFHDAHRAAGTHAGGLHVDLVDDVATDGPRLNRDQALELALWTADRCAR